MRRKKYAGRAASTHETEQKKQEEEEDEEEDENGKRIAKKKRAKIGLGFTEREEINTLVIKGRPRQGKSFLLNEALEMIRHVIPTHKFALSGFDRKVRLAIFSTTQKNMRIEIKGLGKDNDKKTFLIILK